MKIKKLTTRQAWLRIAKAFNSKKTRMTDYGLCNAVDEVFYTDLINEKTFLSMHEQIRGYMLEINCSNFYLFPLTGKWRRARAKLARKLAKETEL